MTKERTAKVGLLAKEDPPPSKRAGSVYADIVALIPELRGHRGEWFRVAEFTNTSGASTQAKKLQKDYGDRIEVAHRRPEGGTGSVLYVKWVGTRGGAER